ncbi:MAG: hypothetical protein ACTSRG_24455 [Candidatus Helarchaeota archaeon]
MYNQNIRKELYGNKTPYGLLILIIFSIGVFGIYHGMNIPHISLPGLGTFHIKDLILIMMTAFALHRSGFLKRPALRHYHTPLKKPLLFLLLLTLINTIINIIQGLDPHYLLRGYRAVAYYLVYFITIKTIKTKTQLRKLIVGLFIIAFISSAISYLQFAFGWSLSGSKIEFMSQFDVYRVYATSGYLINFCLFASFSLASSTIIKTRKNRIFIWFLFSWFFGSRIVSFSRNLTGFILLGLILIILINKIQVLKMIYISIPILIIAFFTLNSVVRNISGLGLNEIIESRLISGINDTKYVQGSFENRLVLLGIKWRTVSTQNPLLGIGFNSAVPVSSSTPSNFMVNMSPYALTADNGLANILLLYGFSGIFVFSWIFFSFFRDSSSLYKRLPNSKEKAIILGIIIYNLGNIMGLFFSPVLDSPQSVSIIATSWAIVVLVGRFELKQ